MIECSWDYPIFAQNYFQMQPIKPKLCKEFVRIPLAIGIAFVLSHWMPEAMPRTRLCSVQMRAIGRSSDGHQQCKAEKPAPIGEVQGIQVDC